MTPLQLLAPAKDAPTAIAAIDHGADAVYMGAPSHGARQAAACSLSDIAAVVAYAHKFDVKVFVAVNTLVYDNEIDDVQQLIWDLYRAGADALIVQDLGVLEMKLPPIELHASTQCDIRTPERAAWLKSLGFKQLVLARELTLDEISVIRNTTDVQLEAFVHGALCVSYSGNCQASQVFKGRSANRGECAQMCRLPYDLIDGSGKTVIHSKHLLSLKDMNRLANLESMIDAGVTSFKIEGRLKDVGYVKNVVAVYRRALDKIIEANPSKYCRASHGETVYNFEPRLEGTFNRGFTDYFLTNRTPASIANHETPKSMGEHVGKVLSVKGNVVTVDCGDKLCNGDGLSFFGADGKLNGFRVNRVQGNRLFLLQPLNIQAGTALYRNRSNALDALSATQTATRKIGLDMIFRVLPDGKRCALDVKRQGMRWVTATVETPVDTALNDPREARRRALGKLGSTIYTLDNYIDECPDAFVPASSLSTLRRLAVEALERAHRASYHYDATPLPSTIEPFENTTVDYTCNIANHLAAELYRKAGVEKHEPAIELSASTADNKERRVMLSRYCLRRELGCCLKTSRGSRLQEPLTLRSGAVEMGIRFDCRRCEMSLYKK